MRVLCLVLLIATGSVLTAGELGKADEKAAAIAAEVMEAMGGAQAYEQTRYITWRFFGRRFHVWDKHKGDIRVEDGKGLVVLMNLNTKEGKAWQDGAEITDTDLLAEKLKYGYEAWINDSYWLVMPYKLRDPGVNLSYTREGKTEDGRAADVLTLTFNEVGVTPENKYEVFVDKESRLVTQWAFFTKAEDEKPRFINPWADWKDHGGIKLSADRGKWKHTDVAVLESLPAGTFTSPEPLSLTPPEK
ncbi:MAG: hypothetical protein QNK37_25735 [Acidobacteriota bacterium]|nr:hypothetical protein [Acidobacteriota bacterium]